MVLSDDKLARKRRVTTIVYNIVGFLVGIETSCVVVSIMYYLQYDVKVSNPRIYSSVVLAIYALSNSFGAIVVGGYADRSREIKKIMIAVLALSIVGNLIYTINRIWYILLGRLVCGVFSAITVILSAELRKIHGKETVENALFTQQTCVIVGYALGPASSGLFSDINFSIGPWNITQYNFIGLFMAVLLTLAIILVMLGVTDISRHMTTNTSDSNDEFEEIEANNTEKQEEKDLTLWDIISDSNIMVLVILSALSSYNGGSGELLAYMIGVFIFKLNIKTLSIITTISLLTIVLLLNTVLKNVFTKTQNMVLPYTVCVFGLCIACWCFILPKLIVIHSVSLQYVLVIAPLILGSISFLAQYTLARQIIYRLVPVGSRNFTESVREFICNQFLISGYFYAGFIFSYLQYIMPCFICLILFLYYLFFRKRDVYNSSYKISLKKC